MYIQKLRFFILLSVENGNHSDLMLVAITENIIKTSNDQLANMFSDFSYSSKSIPFFQIHSITKKEINDFCKHTHRVF